MKRLIAVFLIFILTLTLSVFAANGDTAGYIYETDIKAYINGVEVASYNIGGKTAVVVEDIISEKSHGYSYDDSTRTLKLFSLKPSCLVEGKQKVGARSGKIIGRIYKTDIKTVIYGAKVTSYNIGGKTAVCIEDLGADGAFSAIGGRYVWNAASRTISLEFLYKTEWLLSKNININLTVNDDMTEATAVFEEGFHCEGYQQRFKFPEHITDSTDIKLIIPIKADGEIIGYYFRRPSVSGWTTDFTYYYTEKFKEAEKNYIKAPYKTREEIINHFLSYHSSGGVERFDTDKYSFIYISVAGTSWTSYNLVQAYDDGTYIDYGDKIYERNRSPHNLKIDRENEKVTFRYIDRYTDEWYTDYEIDLKAGVINEVGKE